MRVVDLGRGVTIQSPWYDAEEAAAYCHVSQATFIRAAKARGLKYTEIGRRRVYQESELNRLMRLIRAKESGSGHE